MKVSIISVTENGRILSLKICDNFIEKHNITRYTFYKNSDENAIPFPDINRLVVDIFHSNEVIVFVCACGIAVRSIAPLIKSKDADPAVLVIDDNGRFIIPILSGHLGGANCFAGIIAEKIGAVPVITTATDISGKFSPDSFARANNLIISDLSAAKEIAAAVLNGEKIGLISDYECINIPTEIAVNEQCRTGICVSADITKSPFEITLNLVPKNVVVGIGCKRRTPCEAIERLVCKCLGTANIDISRVYSAATIDIKADENGLLEFCEKHKIKLFTYTAEELMSVDGNFEKSDFVLSHTGTDNVCERSVVRHGGTPITAKTAENGVTVAVGELTVILDFTKEIL